MIPSIWGDVIYPLSCAIRAFIYVFALSVSIFSGQFKRALLHWGHGNEPAAVLLWVGGGSFFIAMGIWGIPLYIAGGLGYLVTRSIRNRNKVGDQVRGYL